MSSVSPWLYGDLYSKQKFKKSYRFVMFL